MKLAVIGGIGSGKSEVCKVAKEIGFNVVSADQINKEMLMDKAYLKKLELAFPKAFFNGKFDKQILANEVFCDKKKLQKLNSIAHPEIVKRLMSYNGDNLVVELPLIFESGCASAFDNILLIDTKFRLRIKRLKGRGIVPSKSLRIMRAQVPTSKLRKISTYIIKNNGSLNDLRNNAKCYLSTFLELETKKHTN